MGEENIHLFHCWCCDRCCWLDENPNWCSCKDNEEKLNTSVMLYMNGIFPDMLLILLTRKGTSTPKIWKVFGTLKTYSGTRIVTGLPSIVIQMQSMTKSDLTLCV